MLELTLYSYDDPLELARRLVRIWSIEGPRARGIRVSRRCPFWIDESGFDVVVSLGLGGVPIRFQGAFYPAEDGKGTRIELWISSKSEFRVTPLQLAGFSLFVMGGLFLLGHPVLFVFVILFTYFYARLIIWSSVTRTRDRCCFVIFGMLGVETREYMD